MSELSHLRGAKSSPPPAPVASGMMQRQCGCGRHTMGGECEGYRQRRRSLPVQAKLMMPHSRDASEAAADLAGAAVMDGRFVPPETLSLRGSPQGISVPSRLTDRVEEMEGLGQPLPQAERRFFESRFSRDLSQVRVHTDHPSSELARNLEAHAFTFGRNIAFRPGSFSAGTQAGRSLMAHELAHVIQQGAAPGRGAGLVQRSFYSSLKERAYAGLIAGLRKAKNTAMNALRSRVPGLPPQYQEGAYTIISIVETVIEIQFSILYAVIGTIVGFSEGIVDMLKGLATLIYGGLKVLGDLVMGIFTNFNDLKADVDAIIAAIKGLPGALKKLVTDWIDQFSKASTERQSLMIGELTGQVLALIATYAVSVSRAGSAARVAAGSTELAEAGAETTAKLASSGAKATGVAADVGTTSAKPAGATAEVATTGAKATGTAAELGEASTAAKPALRVVSGGRATSTTAAKAGSSTARTSVASRTASTAVRTLPKAIPLAYREGATALKYAPEVEEADAAAPKQPVLRALPNPPPEPLAVPEIVEPVAPAFLPPAVGAPAVAAKTGTATKAAVAIVEATAVATDAATKAKKKGKNKEKNKECNEDPCDVLPILWPEELPPPTEAKPMKRTSSSQRGAEGIDRGPDQQRFARCLRRVHENGEDYQQTCGDLGGDWFEPDPQPGQLVDAHHMHPLYLGGEDAPYNLGAVEHNRHMLTQAAERSAHHVRRRSDVAELQGVLAAAHKTPN
jgi:hypothetical protein